MGVNWWGGYGSDMWWGGGGIIFVVNIRMIGLEVMRWRGVLVMNLFDEGV